MKYKLLFLLSALLLIAMGCLAAAAESLSLPEGTQVIEAEAFLNCTSLTGALVIPDGVLEIGASAFAGCDGFTGVPEIPGSVRSIGAHAFDGCGGLSGTLYLATDVEVDATTFDNCPNLTVVRSDFLPMRVALVADGPVDDGGMNADCYGAIREYCDANDFEVTVFEGEDDGVSLAVAAGCNVVVTPGFMYADAVAEASAQYPDVRFIGLDFSLDNQPDNLFTATYREEQAGFLAGYAAVRLGYRHLGFLGGMAIPSVNRYGCGFVQGADAAAAELGVADETTVEFGYAGSFGPTAEITARMRKWYDAMGVEVVFACGGGIWGSVGGAVAECGRGQLIGVDTDQAAEIDGIFGEGTTVTSAMKDLGVTVKMALEAIGNEEWEALGGASAQLGIVSADPAMNHVGLAPSTRFGSGFTEGDYRTLAAGLYSEKYAVSEDLPDTRIAVRTEDPMCVAVITDEGGVEDRGFNQAAYEGAQAWCVAGNLPLRAYALGEEQDGLEIVEQAAASGFDVMILPGFLFAETIAETQQAYPDVKFIGLDISADDLGGNIAGNTFLATYREEQAGFLAGYAAVRLGYRHLGFIGGMAIPSVMRYGYGFAQGADAAAAEMSVADDVTVEFDYADAFWPSDELTERMRAWYARGVEVVFSCGGGILDSVIEAASDTEGAMVIGVDVDQAADIGEARALTSAMKALGATARMALEAIGEGNWATLGGTARQLGIVSGDPEENHVGLAPSTKFAEGFTAQDYAALTRALCDGQYVVSDSTEVEPQTLIQVNWPE